MPVQAGYKGKARERRTCKAAYYTKKIAETENWNLQDIYSDEGKSGTSLRKRDAFKRMMRDAKDQKMDLIICASISRFARNFSDCMTQIAALKTMHPAHPIGVYFETENIYTLNPNSQYNLDIQALLADWESGNKSRRMIQALLEANGLAAGKDHQFKGRYDAEKNAVIISLKNGE